MRSELTDFRLRVELDRWGEWWMVDGDVNRLFLGWEGSKLNPAL